MGTSFAIPLGGLRVQLESPPKQQHREQHDQQREYWLRSEQRPLHGGFRVSRVEAFRCRTVGLLGLAEKPKVEQLQMDWLRSDDLKEEKDVTAPRVIIAVEGLLLCVVAKRRSRSGQ